MTQSLYSRAQVEEWQANLDQIADLPRMTFTKKEVVEELIDTIEKTLEKRSYREVADGLKKWGLDISESALMKYVSQIRKARKQPEATEVNLAKDAKSKTRKTSASKRPNSNTSSRNKPADELTVIPTTTHPPVEVASNPPVEASRETAVSQQKEPFRKTGKGRLKSDENSSRYPGKAGEPIPLNSEL